MNKHPINDIVSKDPKDYIDCAQALMILSYHNKGFLDRVLAGNNNLLWIEVISLLEEAKKLLEASKEKREEN